MFEVMTILAVVCLFGVIPSSCYYIFVHKPKQLLSPSAYRAKMDEIEDYRLKAIESAKSDEDIDTANRTLDELVHSYKSRRK